MCEFLGNLIFQHELFSASENEYKLFNLTSCLRMMRSVNLLGWKISGICFLHQPQLHHSWFLPTLVLLRLLYQEDLQLQLRPPDPLLRLVPAGSIRNMEIRQLTAGNLVPCQKTSSPAGGNPCPTCRFFSSSFRSRGDLLLLPHLPEGYPLQSQVFG